MTEKLNELKNRISFALKEETLQQGFEIICKKLSQLEKENEQLRKENKDIQTRYHIVPEHYLSEAIDRCNELEAQIEKMKSFIHSEIDFCMYCPLTKECRNEEGTCPYAYATEEEQKNLLMDFIKKWEIEK